MKYIIMADGKGSRWNKYKGIEKHFIRVNNETIIERTIRLVKTMDPSSEIIITSHNPKYDFKDCSRYEPLNNEIEIDRFTFELIDNGVCFLYGDTLYTETAIKKIVSEKNDSLLFFGTKTKIVAIKVSDKDLMIKHFLNVRQLFLDKKIDNCIGWQLYQSFQDLPYDKIQIKDNFSLIADETKDFNTPEDYENFIRHLEKLKTK